MHFQVSKYLLQKLDIDFREFTCIQAIEQVIQSILRFLDATLDDGVLPLDLALGKPGRQLLDTLWIFWDKVKNNESLHAIHVVNT